MERHLHVVPARSLRLPRALDLADSNFPAERFGNGFSPISGTLRSPEASLPLGCTAGNIAYFMLNYLFADSKIGGSSTCRNS
jgi:hypothetical protein